jgi:glycerate-2-kinase
VISFVVIPKRETTVTCGSKILVANAIHPVQPKDSTKSSAAMTPHFRAAAGK